MEDGHLHGLLEIAISPALEDRTVPKVVTMTFCSVVQVTDSRGGYRSGRWEHLEDVDRHVGLDTQGGRCGIVPDPRCGWRYQAFVASGALAGGRGGGAAGGGK